MVQGGEGKEAGVYVLDRLFLTPWFSIPVVRRDLELTRHSAEARGCEVYEVEDWDGLVVADTSDPRGATMIYYYDYRGIITMTERRQAPNSTVPDIITHYTVDDKGRLKVFEQNYKGSEVSFRGYTEESFWKATNEGLQYQERMGYTSIETR